MSNGKILTIAVSTVAPNFNKLINKLLGFFPMIESCVDIIVISQLENENSEFYINGLRVLLSTDVGLSKSRNLAIKKCETDWLWFQDDDVKILTDNLHDLLIYLKNSCDDLNLVKVGSLENPSEDFKNYSRYDTNKIYLSCRVSSIEIIIRTNFVESNRVVFDERLGLGTNLPSCEENLFFYECVVLKKARYSLYPHVVCLHTKIAESRSINHYARYKARGYFLRKTFNIYTPLIFFWWSVRKNNDRVGRFKRARVMFSGFFS